jgi:valyl-tRNA synthetase
VRGEARRQRRDELARRLDFALRSAENARVNAPREFEKRFDFKTAEPEIYQRWLDADAFTPAYRPDGSVARPEKVDAKPFVIVIPPPNITGRLHMGHALNNTVQDVLIRHKRMAGFDALWIPGTDHAGIATQTVVKKQLDAQGLDFRALGRDEVVKRIWAWKESYGNEILNQLRRMGCSCDWSRTRFTMDEGLSEAVRYSFVELFRQGLIYRGKRIVNWCPVDRTALSDDEVEKEDVKGKMYRIRYPLADDPSRWIVVGTTRPETLFGDVAVAVNAKDPRYTDLIGKTLRLPLQGRLIPVITDVHADPTKGTGAVKITPAHDPNDFEVGQRHGLEPIDVMNEDATMNDVVPERFRGKDRYATRKLVLEELEQLGLLDGIDEHLMSIGSSYRSKVPIEYRLSDQWFVKMEPLARQALNASGFVEGADGWTKPEGAPSQLTLWPERFDKVYLHWLSNIRDWCISRQIWWGHRIPAWYHVETGETLVDVETPARVAAEPGKWRQDEDVLDTWFSSWLWPMSTLGWPAQTADLGRYYPTSVLSTAKDILFFWVARMNFAGLRFLDEMPYRDVYLHSTIADEAGVTMSKSKGNGIDPLTLIDGATVEDLKRPIFEARPTNMKELVARIEKRFPQGFEAVGADAMRWTLVFSITEGENVRLSLDRFTEGRNFITKLWNGAGRVITTLWAEEDRSKAGDPIAPETDEDTWLLARLDSTIREVTGALDVFDFGRVAQALYHFVWDDFCAWALELSKTRLASEDTAVRRGALSVLGSVLADMLRLLHPITPFVTEALWARLTPGMSSLGLWRDRTPTGALLCLDVHPTPRRASDAAIEARFGVVQRFVSAVRSLRAQSNVKDNLRIDVEVKAIADEARVMIERMAEPIAFLAKIGSVRFVDGRRKGMAAEYDPAFELYIDLAAWTDVAEEVKRLEKSLEKLDKEIAGHEAGLANPAFVDKAPPEKVEERRRALADARARREKIAGTVTELREVAAAR